MCLKRADNNNFIRYNYRKERNKIGETKIDMDVTKEEMKEYDALFCKCKNPNHDNAKYVENYMGVSHGWICPKCKKFLQIG